MNSLQRISLAMLLGLSACGSDPNASADSAEPKSPKSSSSAKAKKSAKASSDAPSAAPTADAPTASPAPTSSAATPAPPATGCAMVDKVRICSAEGFLTAWKATPTEDRYTAFPPGQYKISGKLLDIRKPEHKSVDAAAELRAGADKKIDLRFKQDSPDLAKLEAMKIGDTLSATCTFGGLESVGIVTFEPCNLP